MKILLFGGSGRLGKRMIERLSDEHEIVAPPRQRIDIQYRIDPYIDRVAPQLILNCSAYNGLENCRQFPRQAVEVNCMAVGMLATAANRLGADFIHFSTDYAEPAVDVYGATKYAGEKLALIYAKAAVFRLMSLYDPRDMAGSLSPVKHVLDGKNSRENPCKVLCQITAPTFTGWVADYIAALLRSNVRIQDIGLLELSPYGRERKNYFGEAAVKLFLGRDCWVEEANELPIKRPDFSVFNTQRAQWLSDRIGMGMLPSVRDNLEYAYKSWQNENHDNGLGQGSSNSARSA